jgi:hypothetical protein
MKRLFKTAFLEYDSRIMAKPTQSQRKLPKSTTAQEVPVTNPHNLVAVYANHFGVSGTMTDFTIFFLEMGQIPGPDGAIKKQEIKSIVTLPMLAAPALIQVLQQTLGVHTSKLEEAQKQMESGQ